MDSPYLLIPVILMAVFLYSVSFILFRTGIITKVVHRKIWNSLLLITFLVTAILGLLLAVQINYKLEWPLIKAILKWHVNFGIGMSVVAVIHLTWHFNYYLKLFAKVKESVQSVSVHQRILTRNIEHLGILILLSGFISTVIQVLFLREITTIFQGNELMLAWALGMWMLLTGTGAYLGKNIKPTINYHVIIQRILSILAIVPFISIILMVFIKSTLFPTGVLIHPAWYLLIVLMIFAPVGLLSGWLFALFIAVSGKKEKNLTRVYIIETIGSLAGGLAAAFIFIWWLSPMESILITSILIFISLFYTEQKKPYLFISLFPFFILLIFLAFPIENQLKSSIYRNQTIKKNIETWHGNITITENAGQFNIFENGVLSFSSDNTIQGEEFVHYALLQHKNPQHILLVAGGMSGMLKEITKYPTVKIIDYIEPNPQLIKLVSEYIPLISDDRIHLFDGDPRRYIKNTDRKYDVVIMAIPDPVSLYINRLYTIEFIESLKKVVKPGGIVIYGTTPAGNYISTEKKELKASLYNNLKTQFFNTEIIPGEKDYFIASDSTVSIGIGELSEGWEDLNTYVNPYYMDDNSIRQRSKFILSALKGCQTVNTDEKPGVLLSATLHYLSMFNRAGFLFIILPILILLLPIFFMDPSARGMFIAGTTASSVEITLIFIFQIVFGYVYSSIGLIIAVFMAGLAIGAFMSGRIYTLKHIQTLLCLTLAVSVAFIPLCFNLMKTGGDFFSMALLLVNILVPAILTGSLFYFYSSQIKNENAPGIIYASDLIGSAFGIVAVTLYLLPVSGIAGTCYIISGVNILPVIFNLKK